MDADLGGATKSHSRKPYRPSYKSGDYGMTSILDTRLVWLREKLARNSNIPNCIAELIGVYDPISRIITISLVITIDGTEYRVVRCHKPIVLRQTDDEITELRKLHRNMIAYMIKTYGDVEWSVIVEKFLKWSTNPTHKAVMQRWATTSGHS